MAPTTQTAAAARPKLDPLRETRVLQRYVQLGVYGILLAFIPIQIFLLGEPLKWAIINNAVFFTLATLAIEGAFTNGRKIRKRIAYPVFTILEMQDSASLEEACGSAAATLNQLMRLKASVLAVRGQSEAHGVIAAGMDEDAARQLVDSFAPTIESVRETGAVKRIGRASDQLIFIPLAGAHEKLGVLILCAHGKSDVKDTQTIENIGTRLGLYFETLWQKEEIARQQAYSQAILTAIPDDMLRARRDGTITYHAPTTTRENRVIPDNPIGLNVYDLVPPDLSGMIRTNVEAVLDTGSPAQFETTGEAASGKVYREVRVVPFADDEVLAMIRDVSDRRRALEALEQREEYFRQLIENALDAIVVIAGDGTVTYASPAVLPIMGYEPEELVGNDALGLIHPDDREKLIQNFARDVPLEGKPSERVEFRAAHKSGAWRVLEATARQITPGSAESEIVVNARDVTDRKEAADILRESEERMRTIIEEAPIGMAIVASDLRLLSVNKALCDMLGFSEEELVEAGIRGVTQAEDTAKDENEMNRLMSGEIRSYRMEKRYRTKSGELMWGDLTATVIRDAQGNVLYGLNMIENITDRKRAEDTVRHLAFHDPLTGLPNRALFHDRLELAIAQARRSKRMAAVMFLDLDRFKIVNDSVGHVEGDQLLSDVAEKISHIVREGDTVSRVGGDEFTILLPTIDTVQDAVRIADRILRGLSEPFALAGKEFLVTGSIGITIIPEDGTDVNTLLRNADIAMYRAKEQGRNQYQLYAPQMNEAIVERLAFETSLRHAIERGEFLLHFQPQFDVQTMAVTGVEALVRWQRDEGTLMTPAEFIPVAEETGLILQIGEWVLRESCRQAMEWQRAGLPPVRVSVNVSAREFHNAELARRVQAALDDSGLDPAYLQIEITEGVAMEHADVTLHALTEIKKMGVQVALDDFGVGYSSLGYLKRFPIDVLKIDCSFVRNVGSDAADTALVGAIITMAHSLNMRVIAEGVEEMKQLEYLRDPGARTSAMPIAICDEFQGYLASRPIPAGDVEPLIRKAIGAEIPGITSR